MPGVSRQAGCYCSLQGSGPGRTEDYFSPPVVYGVLSRTKKARYRDEAPGPGSAWFLHVLQLKYVVFSTTGSYHKVLEGNHSSDNE